MRTVNYLEQIKRIPANGKQLIGQVKDDTIIVYQAFNPAIASYAVKHQQFGGPAYSFNRMSWIKPGFLWMMYRAGWAMKENQQHILAISLPLVYFKQALNQAVITSWNEQYFDTQDEWKIAMQASDVRLQWDPDHDPYGNKQERKAIQLGMKGETLRMFCTTWIRSIEDITGYVKEQYSHVESNDLASLKVPFEEIIELEDDTIACKIGLSF